MANSRTNLGILFKRFSLSLAIAALMNTAAWADTFDLGVLSPSAFETADYPGGTGGLSDDFYFSIAAGDWVTIEFQGMPDSGTGLNSVEFFLRNDDFSLNQYWAGYDSSYYRSYTYTGLSVGEDYHVNVYGWSDPMGSGAGSYKMTLTAQSLTSPVPEPETYAMLLAGLSLIGAVARRRKQSAVA